MVVSRDQNAWQSHYVKTDNSSFQRMEEFKYLGTTLTNQNSIQEEIKSRLKSGNACYHSVQNLLSYSLLSKNIKVKIYRTIILPFVFYWCETCLLTLREDCRLRVFENRVLGRIFGPKRDEVTEICRNYTMRSTMIYTPYQILYRSSNWEWDGGHLASMGEKCTHGFGGETWGKDTIWKTQAQMGWY